MTTIIRTETIPEIVIATAVIIVKIVVVIIITTKISTMKENIAGTIAKTVVIVIVPDQGQTEVHEGMTMSQI